MARVDGGYGGSSGAGGHRIAGPANSCGWGEVWVVLSGLDSEENFLGERWLSAVSGGRASAVLISDSN